MIPALVIRPEPGAAASVAALRQSCIPAQGFPLFAVVPVAWEAPDPTQFDVLLAGSANAFRHGGADLSRFRDLPVHAVGAVTAEAARAAGFTVAATGHGGLQEVLAEIPAEARVLRLAGEERVMLTPPAGVELAERVVYASQPLAMPPALAKALERAAVVLLHSAAAARHFAGEVDRLTLPRARIAIATIGPRVTAAAGPGWRALATAAQPAEPALLAAARELCHTLASA
jgi:uroporphyrinogen-III synthase